MNDNAKTPDKSNQVLGDLNDFLDKKRELYINSLKADRWYWEDINIFFDDQVIPVFTNLVEYFKKLPYLNVEYKRFEKVCRLTIRAKLDFFIFRVLISNDKRSVIFSQDILFRKEYRQKMRKIDNCEEVYVSFKESETITEEFVVALFTRWYKEKYETIAKAKQL